jgi:phosphoribosylaminoimidazolecarboxamide formyltransferase/IMP cyclohydrolase
LPHIRRALISVSDKRGVVDFARSLQEMGVTIISTGGTAALLRSSGIQAISVSEVTGFPEILNGRVKTLHPRIYGGILALGDSDRHQSELREHGIDPIDLIVVNLYPFEQTIARNGIPLDEALEQIDIGGPAMIRAAAKNFRHKAVVVNPDRYPVLIRELQENHSSLSENTCFELAREVFVHTSLYDSVIAGYLTRGETGEHFPPLLQVDRKLERKLRYGENPHQQAALFGNFGSVFEQLHGKELSYNNIVDTISAARLVADFDEPTIAIIKHTNPCGVGSGSSPAEAYVKALATDPKSAYGGVLASNRPIDHDGAAAINMLFTEIIVAPGYAGDSLDILQKKKDRRLMRVMTDLSRLQEKDVRSVPGGFLVQDADNAVVRRDQLKVVTKRQPTEGEMKSMLYAWRVARHVKSNAIVYAAGDRSLGIGAGQMSRVDSARIAAMKASEAGLDLNGSSVASDAFFPFADGLLEAVKAGSTSVIQPGGSIRDEEIIRAADDHHLTMVFTGIRHFKH